MFANIGDLTNNVISSEKDLNTFTNAHTFAAGKQNPFDILWIKWKFPSSNVSTLSAINLIN